MSLSLFKKKMQG